MSQSLVLRYVSSLSSYKKVILKSKPGISKSGLKLGSLPQPSILVSIPIWMRMTIFFQCILLFSRYQVGWGFVPQNVAHHFIVSMMKRTFPVWAKKEVCGPTSLSERFNLLISRHPDLKIAHSRVALRSVVTRLSNKQSNYEWLFKIMDFTVSAQAFVSFS